MHLYYRLFCVYRGENVNVNHLVNAYIFQLYCYNVRTCRDGVGTGSRHTGMVRDGVEACRDVLGHGQNNVPVQLSTSQ